MRRVLRELMSEYKNLSRGNTSLYDIETTCGPVPADRYGSTQGPFESCVVAVLKGTGQIECVCQLRVGQ